MTSSYSDKIAKVKNALESVFVKKADIKDNLISTDTNKPLSANQGKVLDTNKVDKISGKSLSTNDFTNTYKTKMDNLDSLLSQKANTNHDHGNLQNDGSVGTSNNVNKNVITDGNGKITVEDKPTIPSKTSDLTNDSGFITSENIKSNSITNDTGSTTKCTTVKAVEDYAEPKKEIGTFTELETLINNASAGDTIVLEKDYKNTENLSKGFAITKKIHIDGKGHLIDYNNAGYGFILTIPNSTIENCIIEGGATNGLPTLQPYADNCSLINIIYRNTNGISHPLIYAQGNNTIIKNCYFYNNIKANFQDMISVRGSNCYIEDCIFFNNNVGTIIATNSNGMINSCIFLNNITYYGAIRAIYDNDTIINCIFESNTLSDPYNTSHFGGAITGSSSSKIINSKFLTNTDTIYPSTIVQKEYLTDTTDQVSSGSTVPVTSGAVYSAINSLNTQLNEAISTSFKVEVLYNVDAGDILRQYEDESGDAFRNYVEEHTNIQLSYDSSTIYLVPNGREQGPSYYNEYIYVEIENNYELIGTTDIDLSNYVQKSSTVGLLKNDGTVMTSGTGANNFAAGNHTHSQYLTSHQDISGKLNKSELLNELNTIVEDLIDEGDS